MLKKLYTRDDGVVVPHYIAENGETLIKTGPIDGVLTLSDGTSYDVSDHFVAVPEQHHDELVHAIGDHYETHGHPHLMQGEITAEFVHDREATQAMLDERRTRLGIDGASAPSTTPQEG